MATQIAGEVGAEHRPSPVPLFMNFTLWARPGSTCRGAEHALPQEGRSCQCGEFRWADVRAWASKRFGERDIVGTSTAPKFTWLAFRSDLLRVAAEVFLLRERAITYALPEFEGDYQGNKLADAYRMLTYLAGVAGKVSRQAGEAPG